MVRLVFWQLRGTENRPLSSLELFVYSQSVVLLQEKEGPWNRNQASSPTGHVGPLLTRAHSKKASSEEEQIGLSAFSTILF